MPSGSKGNRSGVEKFLEIPEGLQDKLEKVVIWLPRGGGGKWDEGMRKLTQGLEAVTAVALEHGIEVRSRVVDDSQCGVTKFDENV